MTAFSSVAADVGGDYYDIFQVNAHKFALIVGDVAGKGVSAAFHMAEMKGVFQSYAQMGMKPDEFLIHANSALSRCLDRTSFITVSYFLVDTQERTIEFSRAGHCPTLYYHNEEGKAEFFSSKGLGLGILRNSMYEDFVIVNKMCYKDGDVLPPGKLYRSFLSVDQK